MKTLVLMQGVPGSGKSTMVEALLHRFGFSTTKVFSTDEFWGVEYNYDPSRIAEAHQWNQDRTKDAMARGMKTVIVDNTNIRRDHVQPYLKLATEYGYTITVVRVDVKPHIAVARQLDRPASRRVPADVIFRMHREMENLI